MHRKENVRFVSTHCLFILVMRTFKYKHNKRVVAFQGLDTVHSDTLHTVGRNSTIFLLSFCFAAKNSAGFNKKEKHYFFESQEKILGLKHQFRVHFHFHQAASILLILMIVVSYPIQNWSLIYIIPQRQPQSSSKGHLTFPCTHQLLICSFIPLYCPTPSFGKACCSLYFHLK